MAEVARQRIRDSGLADQCCVEVRDDRDLGIVWQFDNIVSVGMFEHVGEAPLAGILCRTWQLLRSGGAFLNRGIAASVACRRQAPSFIDRYVFPDSELTTSREACR